MSEWVRGRVGGSVTLYLVDTIATTGFDQSLSNFTCKLWMMRGGTLSILNHGIKGQSQLCGFIKVFDQAFVYSTHQIAYTY